MTSMNVENTVIPKYRATDFIAAHGWDEFNSVIDLL